MTDEGVDVLFHATLCGVNKSGNHIESVSFVTKSGVMEFSAKAFIDCTGDADLMLHERMQNSTRQTGGFTLSAYDALLQSRKRR